MKIVGRFGYLTAWALLACGIAFFIVAAYKFSWSGTGFTKKTLWDWLQLLAAFLIPIAIAVFSVRYSQQQSRTENAIATDNQQEMALQSYLDRISELLLEKDLRSAKEGDEIRTVARARTLSVLHQLNGRRKGNLMQFLDGSHLIDVIDLNYANLSYAEMSHIDLTNADLRGVDLSHAILKDVSLRSAKLFDANLSYANFSNTVDLDSASLDAANLTRANMRHISLIGASLVDSNLSYTNLADANLSKAKLADANLSNANLSHSDLSGASLAYARLHNADLSQADLSGSDLLEADLSGANLNHAKMNNALVVKGQLDKAKFKVGVVTP